jgi:predicted nucleotidyltransferase
MNRPAASRITELRCVIEGDPRIQLAILFGSVARGTSREGSDVDIAYLPHSGAGWSLHDELELEGKLATIAGCEVDLVNFGDAALPLKWRIVRDGVILLARSKAERRLIAETALEYLDIEPLLESSGRTYLARLASGTGQT